MVGEMGAVERAGRFFQDNGRDIDKALFAFHFGAPSRGGASSLDALLETLGRYQNSDGGFGRHLEVDIAAPDSNPFATELALWACIQTDVPRDHPLLQRTVAHLEQTQDEDGCWRFTENIYAHDLAPWFRRWTFPDLNPACTTAGLLKALGLGSDRLHARVERLFGQLARPEHLTGDAFYAVRPYAFYFLPQWQHPQREFYLTGVLWWLIRQHATEKIEDSGHFFEYVRGPHSWIGERLPQELLNARLDMLAAEQQEDGGWPTPYASGWRGWVTVQSLTVLRAFGRV